MALVLTVLDGAVTPDRGTDLQTAWAEVVSGSLPSRLVRSSLLQDSNDPTRWRIETVWESYEALSAMRQAGKPKGVLMFEAAGTEPSLSVFDIVDEVESQRDRAWLGMTSVPITHLNSSLQRVVPLAVRRQGASLFYK